MAFEVRSGSPQPLGASWDGAGTNFAVVSENATAISLCVFDARGRETAHELTAGEGGVWHGYLAGAGPGQRYGYRAYGPFAPADGHRFNPAKLLLDPYARAIDGPLACTPAMFGGEDSAREMPKAVVVDGSFDWGDDRHPRTPHDETVIYEVHVKGYTRQHPDIPPPLRGTYAGLGHPAAVEHLVELGVTAVELMPVQHFVHSMELLAGGQRNYWGYDTIGYFAPHAEYSSRGTEGGQIVDFKAMVKSLHAAGLEVILDVVYNHTGEGDHRGPTLCFRGLDNALYYRLVDGDRRYYFDLSGTGNSLDVRSAHVLALITDSLRYWVREMHVDGFRFDLAVALGRDPHDFDPDARFLRLLRQDPVLAGVKLIAEPWDVADGGYQLGRFPRRWSEWNDRYRETARSYWRGDEWKLGELATRFVGSSDIFASSGRRPQASVNYVTAHDGLTLHDLVSSGHEPREAERQKRNLLATLLLSRGIPMLLGGDELGRTQCGNDNAYAEDNETSWFNWSLTEDRDSLLAFTRRLISLRRRHPVFRAREWAKGTGSLPDVGWLNADGMEMVTGEWETGWARFVAVFLNGDPMADSSFIVTLNAHDGTVEAAVPAERWGLRWRSVLDTSDPESDVGAQAYAAGDRAFVPARSVLVLERVD